MNRPLLFRNFVKPNNQKVLQPVKSLKYNPIHSISPIDGRYNSKISYMSDVFSEYSMMEFRAKIELEWIKKLSTIDSINKYMNVTTEDLNNIEVVKQSFNEKSLQQIKNIENITNHDVKALEYYLRDQFDVNKLKKIKEFIHFGCTSEDINNIMYALMVKKAVDFYLIPYLHEIISFLEKMSYDYSNSVMISRTHGQVATPTTMGKELSVFVYRLKRQVKQLKDTKILAKMAGAVGNYNAHYVVFPDVEWEKVSKDFIESFDLSWNPRVTQIESHDNMSEIFFIISRINNILIDLDRDIWQYISLNYFIQDFEKDSVGSSTMPHKVNPIDFENSEGNLGLANTVLQHISNKIPISRLQRDLTDSTVMRNIGVGITHCMVSYISLSKGLNKLKINQDIMDKDLDNCLELLAEPIQVMMKKYNIEDSYDKVKTLFRNEKISKSKIDEFINSLKELSEEDKFKLLHLTPRDYIGNAIEQAKSVGNLHIA